MEKIGKHNYEAFLLDYIEGNLDEAGIAALFVFLDAHPELKPDLSELGMDAIVPTTTSATSLSPEEKQALKHIPEETEEKIVAYLEGQLSAGEKMHFEKQIAANAKLQQLVQDYRKTFITADNDLQYNAKAQLKRTAIAEDTIVAYLEGQLNEVELRAFETALASDATALALLDTYRQTRLAADTTIVFPDKHSLKREAKVVALFSTRIVLSIAASIVLLLGLFWLLRFNGGTKDTAAEGAMALKKITLPGKQGEHVVTAPQNNSFALAPVPGIRQQDKQSLIRQDQIIPPNNPVPQQMANNPVSSPDTSHTGIANVLNPPVEPRSLIVLNPYIENEQDLKNNAPVMKPDLSTSEYVAKQINKAAWGDEDSNDPPEPAVDAKKVKGFDLLALLSKGLKKLGNQRSDAKKIENGDHTEYVVTIGSLSVSRKVAN